MSLGKAVRKAKQADKPELASDLLEVAKEHNITLSPSTTRVVTPKEDKPKGSIPQGFAVAGKIGNGLSGKVVGKKSKSPVVAKKSTPKKANKSNEITVDERLKLFRDISVMTPNDLLVRFGTIAKLKKWAKEEGFTTNQRLGAENFINQLQIDLKEGYGSEEE